MDLLTCTEAALLVGVSDRSLRKWAQDGRITRYGGPDGRVRYSRAELVAFRAEASMVRTKPRLARNGSRKPVEPATAERESALVAALRQVLEDANRHVAGLHQQLRDTRDREASLTSEAATLRAQVEARERLAREIEFLREQLEASRHVEGTLRVLLLRQSEQLKMVAESEPVTPALPQPLKTPRGWRRFWGRLFGTAY
jgi:TolA-binding protein